MRQYDAGQLLKATVLHSEDVRQKTGSNLRFRLLELGVVRTLDGDMGEGEGGEGKAVPEVAWWGERPPKKGEVHR